MTSETAVCTTLPTQEVGGVPISLTTLDAASEAVIADGRSHQALAVRLVNAYSVSLAQTDPAYAHLLRGPGVSFADGKPVARVARHRSRATSITSTQVRGPSLFETVLDLTQHTTTRHFFLGSNPQTLSALQDEVARRFPDTTSCGAFSPPYADLDDAFIQQCADEINSATPDLVWVALGTPKQDFLAYELSQRCHIVCVGVGAAFDFVAGTVAEAPQFFRRTGLEWLFRLASEPRRLWRRYLIGNAQFLWCIFTEQLAQRKTRAHG